MELLEEEAAFKIGIDTIIQHLQTGSSCLKQSCKRIRKLETSLIHSYNRLGKLHVVNNDHVVFDRSSEALQKEIKSSIEVAQNINTILESILPRHTLDYVTGKEDFFLANFSKSENLKVSKFQKKTVFVRNKIADLAGNSNNIRIRIKESIVKSISMEHFRKTGFPASASFINTILGGGGDEEEGLGREEMSMMMKIKKAMEEFEGISFLIYVMVQTQIAISAYAISEKWTDGHHHNIRRLAKNTRTTLSKMSSFTDDIYYYCCLNHHLQ